MKIFIFSFLFIVSSAMAGSLDCALWKLKLGLLSDVKLSETASFEEIQEAYAKLQKISSDQVFSIEAQRLINEVDWAKALQNPDKYPWWHYGSDTMWDWIRAMKFTHGIDPLIAIDATLLKEIHLIATKNLPFHGFEGRRIWTEYERLYLNASEAEEAAYRAFVKNQELHGVPHDYFRGTFRSSPYDDIVHSGSSFDEAGKRYFTKKEKDGLMDNEYMELWGFEFTEVNPDKYFAKLTYAKSREVSSKVNMLFTKFDKEMKNAKTLVDKVGVIQDVKKGLMTVHPFLDGNGRSIRLLEDLMLRRQGLPPGLTPNEADLIMSIPEAVEYTRKNMIKYINEYVKYHSKVVP